MLDDHLCVHCGSSCFKPSRTWEGKATCRVAENSDLASCVDFAALAGCAERESRQGFAPFPAPRHPVGRMARKPIPLPAGVNLRTIAISKIPADFAGESFDFD